MSEELIDVDYEKKKIACCISYPSGDTSKFRSSFVVLTHGAGGDMHMHQLVCLAHALTEHGFIVVRFTCKALNISYRTRVFQTLVQFFKGKFIFCSGCIVGGRSMGSRAALLLENTRNLAEYIKGVLCISYPLHTKDKLQNLRDEPINAACTKTLFVSGTKDEMCDKKLMEEIISERENIRVMWLENCGHSLEGPKHQTELSDDVVVSICQWCIECQSD